MRKAWLWPGGLVVLVGVAAAALFLYPSMRFRSVLDGALHQLPAGYSASYESASYSIFSRRATVSGLSLHGPQEQRLDATIGEIAVENPDLDFVARWAAA